MNMQTVKSKRHSNAHNRVVHHPQIDKNPSTVSIKRHCLPKDPPNIAVYQHYAHPRKVDDQKENHRGKENHKENHHQLISVKEPIKHKNVLLQPPRKSNQADEALRRTQKRRNRPQRSEWVSPDDEGLGCQEHLSSQIFRQSGQNSISQHSTGYAGKQQMSIQQQLKDFERELPSVVWREDQSSLSELIRLEEEYQRQTHYANYLEKQCNITWKRRAIVIDWAMLLASELNCRREAFAVSVSLLDRYLAVSAALPLEKLQLTMAACLLIAEKLEDNSRLRAYSFYQPISLGHSLEDLLSMEAQIVMKLKFRLKAPTVNAWANRLCAQWDLWMAGDGEGRSIAARFKGGDGDSYHNWRWLAQYIDFALLDIQTLQYKNRTLAAAFLYLTLILKLELHSPEEVSSQFRQGSRHILEESFFNQLFSRFLLDSFGFPLNQILPAVQYCSIFTVLPVRVEFPTLLREDDLSFEEYCGIQTCNECNKWALDLLDRSFW